MASAATGVVYKWTNNINGMMYIGSHVDNGTNYFASGIAVRRALKKYGITNFTREVLYAGPDFRAEEEKMLLDVDAAGSSNYYNLKNTAIGFGSGSDNPAFGVRRYGAANGMYGRKHSTYTIALLIEAGKTSVSAEGRARISAALVARGPWNVGKTAADYSAKALSNLSAAKQGELNPMYGRAHTPATIERMRASHLGKKTVYPDKTCCHCGKTGRGPNMTRYHFDNCKAKTSDATT